MVAKRDAKSSAVSKKTNSKDAAAAIKEDSTHVQLDEEQSEHEDENEDKQEEDDASDDEPQSESDEPQSEIDDENDHELDLDAAQGGDDEDDEELDAVGFGDAMSKILGQNVAEDAQPILAKRTTARMREIMEEKKVTKTARISAAEKREKEQKDMIIPDHTTAVQDRRLRMIATKGVVALFNAIEKHQHLNGKKADDKNDKKVKEMSKDNFLGLLKSSQKSTTKDAAAASAPTAKSSWSVVQDDYMMGAKLKDWDATHGTEKGRVRNDEDEENEAAEDVAWKQVAVMDSDDEGGDIKRKRKAATATDRKPATKKSKRA
uniref:RRP15-like protein n=1 Tax=Globisporangium ultimum (strain ATCC 200006 / CBS 805.95 / DAOM BR144) TaxID=431595 RepID=K3W9B8_GLOUD